MNLGAPLRSANVLQWTTTNANVYVWHAGHAVKLAISLKTAWRPANNQFAFPVGISGLTRSGNAILRDGIPVARLAPFVAYDWDAPEDVRPIAHEFVHVSGQDYILCTLPDLAGMTRPVIDPTVTLPPDLADGVDTYVNQAASSTNYGTDAAIVAGSAANQFRNALLKYDVSSLAGNTVDAAVWHVFSSSNISAARSFTANCIGVANRWWTEAGATWQYQDGSNRWAGDAAMDGGADAGCSQSGVDYNASALGTLSIPAYGGVDRHNTVDLDTSMVQGWIDTANYGFVLRMGSGSAAAFSFRSSDYATDTTKRPYLVVDYTVPGGGPGPTRHFMHYARRRGG